MKKWIWLVLLVFVAVGVVLGGEFFLHSHSESVVESSLPSVQSRADVPLKRDEVVSKAREIVNFPDVSSQQLFAHIKALNYKRYTEADRERARDYLIKSLKSFGWAPTPQPFDSGVNILAQRSGTDPEAGTILVAAHYDTVVVSPGADDNATGVAVLLEIARLLGSHSTPRTLHLALFDKEEEGLQGSIAFVANAAHLKNLQGVIVMDMIGFACHTAGCQKYPTGLPVTPPTDRGDFLAVVGDSEHLPLLSAFQKSSGQSDLPPVLTLPVPLKGMLTPDVLRSDHAPFWYRGIGALLVSDTANLRTPHYHQPSDKPATLNRSFFTGSAQLVVNATTRLLESREPLESQS